MLSSSPYRDVKVIDVARKAGTSPATFYQYFPDVEGAVLEIAEETAQEGAGLTDLVAGRGSGSRHEGDKRFYKIRMKLINAVTSSLADSVKELQAKGKVDKDVSPAAVAGSLVAMLAAVAAHQKGFQSSGVKQADLKTNLALLVHLGVTGRKPSK